MSLKAQTAGNFNDVPYLVTDPERIPVKRYYDERFFRLENERFWPHVWQMACRLEEIPEVGDWVEYRNLDQSVIIVRAKSGVKAFHNACRHRGVALAEGHGNCEVQGFICPFHGWRWNMDGDNTFVFQRHLFSERQLDAENLKLLPCRVETWGGCAFINFDNDAPGLRESLGDLAERFEAHGVDDLRVEWWKSSILPVNWKLAMEAFMEGYHVMATHPQLWALTTPEQKAQHGHATKEGKAKSDSARDYLDVTIKHLVDLHEGMAGMVDAREVPIIESMREQQWPDDVSQMAKLFYGRVMQEITTQFRAKGIPSPDLPKVAMSHPVRPVEYIFPHYFLLPMFTGMSSYRIRPLTAETCLFELWSLTLAGKDEKRPRPVAPAPLPHDDPDYPEIPRQDYSNLPRQQRGLHNKGFEYMRLSKDVEGMISNYQRLIDGYLTGVDREKLAKATRPVCSGLDTPIADIGF